MLYGFKNHIRKERIKKEMRKKDAFFDFEVKIWQKKGQKMRKIAWEYLQTIKSVL